MSTPGEVAFDIMDALRVCLCSSLAQTGAGELCSCIVAPGTIAVADACSCSGRQRCGMAWVRLDRIYPYERFPAVATTGDNGRCGKPLAAVIELGVLRCAPMPTNGGKAPSTADLLNASRAAVEDAGALARAMGCCTALTDRPHVMGTWQARDGGDCLGGVWPVTVALTRR